MPTATANRSKRPKKSAPRTVAHGFEASLYRPRLKRIRAAASERGLSHLLVTNPVDVGYLTGFLGGDSPVLIPVSEGKPTIITDFRYVEELEEFRPLVNVFVRKGSMADAINGFLSDASVVSWGVQAESMTLAERGGIAKALGEHDSKIKPVSGIVAELRAIKDEHEVGLISKAIAIQEKSLLAVLPTIKAGQTELDVGAALEAEMKRRGSVQPAFVSIIAANANGSLPHYRPGNVKLTRNQPLLIDWGARWMGYHGDMTRTFTLGKWPPKIREIYQIVLDAHLMAAAALAPGKTTAEIDGIARAHITKHGYGEFFGHGLGHGLGMNVHEDPRVSHMAAAMPLKIGHVVTNEPGIYLPGVGGVRIEDDFVIVKGGSRNLCSLPKTLEWSTLA